VNIILFLDLDGSTCMVYGSHGQWLSRSLSFASEETSPQELDNILVTSKGVMILLSTFYTNSAFDKFSCSTTD